MLELIIDLLSFGPKVVFKYQPWLYALKQHYMVKENSESGFWLVEIPSNIVHQLYKCYSFLLKIFKTFPFTSDEEDNKMEIYHYITLMMDFLKDKNKSE